MGSGLGEAGEASAGLAQVRVTFGEAEAEEIFSRLASFCSGAKEGGAGYGGYAGAVEEVAGLLCGAGASERA